MVANSVVNAQLWTCHFSAQKPSVASCGPKYKVQNPLPDICPAHNSNLFLELNFFTTHFPSMCPHTAKLNYYFCYKLSAFLPTFPTTFVCSLSSGSTLLSPISSFVNTTYSSNLSYNATFIKSSMNALLCFAPLKSYCSSLWVFVALYLDLWTPNISFCIKVICINNRHLLLKS